MTKPRDPYWDELGVAWCAIASDTNGILSRLRSRLRRQSLLLTAILALGVPATVAGLLIGVVTLWIGWKSGTWNFLTRGSAILIISAIVAKAIWLLMPVRSGIDSQPLSDMLELAVARSQRIITTIRLALGACVIAAIFGLIGTAIRRATGRPPALSPVIDLGVLTILALLLAGYLRQTKTSLAKFRYLRRTIASDHSQELEGQ